MAWKRGWKRIEAGEKELGNKVDQDYIKETKLEKNGENENETRKKRKEEKVKEDEEIERRQ